MRAAHLFARGVPAMIEGIMSNSTQIATSAMSRLDFVVYDGSLAIIVLHIGSNDNSLRLEPHIMPTRNFW